MLLATVQNRLRDRVAFLKKDVLVAKAKREKSEDSGLSIAIMPTPSLYIRPKIRDNQGQRLRSLERGGGSFSSAR